MNLVHRPARLVAPLAAVAFLAASCGGSTESSASTTAAADDSIPTTVAASTTVEPTTTLAPETTIAPETTVAPETTAAPTTMPPTTAAPATTVAPLDLTLRADAIGAMAFGATAPNQLIDTLSPTLGNPTVIDPMEYGFDAGGYYENSFEERGFVFPFGNDVCFGNGLCAYFGGSTADSVTLVGYRQSEGPGSLATASGVTAGSAGADHVDDMFVEAGGCYSTGSGSIDGVNLYLQSTGDLFGYFDDETNEYIAQTPGLADISVISVFSGEEPFFLYDDC